MFKLLLALLALLALSTHAASLPSSTSTSANPNFNSNVTPTNELAFVPCLFPGNGDFERRCYCYEDVQKKYAIDRHWMVTAIDNACHFFTGGIGDLVSMYGYAPGLVPSYTYTFEYFATDDTEQGKVVIAIAIDRTDKNCAGPRPLGWEECWYTLHDPLDDCDSGRENPKNGGIFLHDCLWWIVDPAPAFNQPYPFGIECKDCGMPEPEAGAQMDLSAK